MAISNMVHNTYNTILILLNTTAIVALAVVLFIQEAQRLPPEAATVPAVQQPYIDPILLSERVASRVVADIEHANYIRHIEVRLQRLEHAQRLAERKASRSTTTGSAATTTIATHQRW